MAQSHPLVPLAAAAAVATQRHLPSRASRTSPPAHRRPPRRGRGAAPPAPPPAAIGRNLPPAPPPPAVLVVPNLAPLRHLSTRAKRPSIRRVPVVPRRIRRGKRARLRLTLSAPARLKIVVQRRVHGHRIRVRTLNLDVRADRVSIRLPGRVHGHALKRGLPRVRRGDRRGRRSLGHRAAASAGPQVRPLTAGSLGPAAATAV